MTLAITATSKKGISAAVQEYVNQAIEVLSTKYGFDAAEAANEIAFKVQMTKKGKTKENPDRTADDETTKPNANLIPWTGKSNEEWCAGIVVNHQLYTQCTKERCDGKDLCDNCIDQGEKNGTGKPDHGTVQDRMSNGIFEFKSPKTGKSAVRFGNYMEKNNITREEVLEECGKWGITVPEEVFEVHKAKRGRPKSKDTVKKEDGAPKRGRGRPKSSKVVEASVGDDVIAALVAEANKVKDNGIPAEKEMVKTTSFASPPASPEPKKKAAPKNKSPKKKSPAEVAITNDTGSEAEVEPEPQKKKKASKKEIVNELIKVVDGAKKDLEKEKASKKATKKSNKKEEPEPVAEPEPAMELVEDPYEQETEDESDGDPEIEVSKWTCPADNTVYLLDSNSMTIYDIDTQDEVGTWDADEEKIIPAL